MDGALNMPGSIGASEGGFLQQYVPLPHYFGNFYIRGAFRFV